MKPHEVATAVVVLLIVAAILPSPQCGRGCRNLLQHIVEHELANLIPGLLA
jgi:hypothetical protein